MKKAAIYIRVSTVEQIEGYSLDAQKDKLTSFCKIKDYDIYDIYIDPGYSGSNLERPAIKKLIDDIADIDVVVVYKLDRLSRSQKDTLYLIEDIFLKNNVDFISISESFDTTTPFGRAMIGILSVFAQLERENIKERMMSGRVQRAKNGLHNGSAYAPVGYDYDNGKLIKNNYEALQIHEIIKLYLDGYGPQKIIDIMQERGYKTKYGTWKNECTIRSCLFNPVYRGYVNFAGEQYEGDHEPIVSKELFKKIDAEKKKREKTTPFTKVGLLSGFLFCGKCGARIAIHNRHGKRFYVCYTRQRVKKLMKAESCDNKIWAKDNLEALIDSKISNISYEMETQNFKSDNIKILNGQLNNINKQLKKLMDLYQFSDMPIDEIKGRIEALDTEKQAIKNLLNETKSNKDIKNIVTEISKQWANMDFMQKRSALSDFVEKIYITDDEVNIVINR